MTAAARTACTAPLAEDTAPSAPGTVTLGTPTGAGIPYTMPSLPSGAGSLILEVSANGDDWFQGVTGLAGGAAGIYVGGRTSADPAGEGGQTFVFRAKNTTGGAAGTLSNTTSASNPSLPDAPTNVSNNLIGTVTFDTPAQPTNATNATGQLYFETDGSGFSDSENAYVWGATGQTWNYPFGLPSMSLKIRLEFATNIYGTNSPGAEADVPIT